MHNHYDDFIRAENILNFRRKLAEEKDPARRRTLETLLAAEVAGVAPPDQGMGNASGQVNPQARRSQ